MNRLMESLTSLTDKNGRHLSAILSDMRDRDNAVLICNLGADDPDAPISVHLLHQHGEQVAQGLRLLIEAGACTEIIVYCGTLDAGVLVNALKLTGIPVTDKAGPSSPVLREPTALYAVLDTGVIRVGCAEEDYLRTYLSYGYQGRPTLVIDAETAYQACCLYESPDAPLKKHIAVIGTDTDIKAIVIGTKAAALIEGITVSKQILVGGVGGRYMSADDLENTEITYSYDFDCVRVLRDTDCIVTDTAELYRNIKELSCAKCVMCREGSWQLHAVFNDMAEGKATRDDIALIEDICPLISAGALCDFGRNMVQPALTAAAVCCGELTEHIVGKKCPAGKCKGMLNYVIDPALCTGCGACLDICPEEAIEGKDGFIHMIEEKLCIKCGKCVPICPEGAIKYGGEKIRVPKKLTRVGQFR